MPRQLTDDRVLLTARVIHPGPAADFAVGELRARDYAPVEGSDTDWVGVVLVAHLDTEVAWLYTRTGRPLAVTRIEPRACAAGQCVCPVTDEEGE